MTRRFLAALMAWVGATAAWGQGAMASGCRAESGPTPPLVVELYTSEGCNSCPPADRWLSTLKGRRDVIAAAFHVDYWDRLGWKDRFASPRFTERQTQVQSHSGARFSYTPQVLVNGRDWRRWPDLPAAPPAALAQLSLQRVGDQVEVQVRPAAGSPSSLSMWWAVLEDGHTSDVKAGENTGATLRHDHVVSRYGVLPAWSGATLHRIDAPPRGEGSRPVRVIAVVTDANTGLPVQAAQLVCSSP